MVKHKFWDGTWTIEHKSKDGELLHREVVKNALVDQGEMILLTTFFRNTDQPAAFFAGLCNDDLDETSTLTTMSQEPVQGVVGYTRIEIERGPIGFPTLEIYEGDYRIQSKELAWTAVGGTIGPVRTVFLATSLDNGGYLVAFVNMTAPRIITDGSTLTVRFQIRLQ